MNVIFSKIHTLFNKYNIVFVKNTISRSETNEVETVFESSDAVNIFCQAVEKLANRKC